MNGKEVRALQERGIEVLMATKASRRRMHDFRPEKPKKNKKLQARKPWILETRKELEKKENRDLYRLRKQTVEPVFWIVKRVMGFRPFLLRGLKKVELESVLSRITLPLSETSSILLGTRILSSKLHHPKSGPPCLKANFLVSSITYGRLRKTYFGQACHALTAKG